MPEPRTSRNVGEIMTRDLSCSPPSATVQQVAQVMAERNVGAIPITAGGRLAGIITDRDIAIRVVAPGLDVKAEPVGNHMTRQVITVAPDLPVDEAVQLMERQQIRRLPVVERGAELVGIVALGDLATKAPKPAEERERVAGKALEGISQPSRPRSSPAA